MIDIRPANANDYVALADVMFDAVRNGRSPYTDKQRQAWVPERRHGPDWVEKLDQQSIFVADDTTQLLGFMSLAANGYVDFAFIRPAAQGTGLFRRLYQAIEALAQKRAEQRLWVHASLMAQPAFSAMGFSIVKKESVEIRGQTFDRFEMQKLIGIP